MIEETALEVGLKLLKKFWPYLVISALCVALAITRGHLLDLRKADGEFRHQIAVELHQKKEDRPTLLTALHTTVETNNNRGNALAQISREALEAGQRSKANDAALERQLNDLRAKYALAQHQITALEARKSTGNLEADWQLLVEDTKAAWKDWK
jgi:hypothetical protein